MQVYKVPYNFNHEEKVFGGYLSIRQAIYLIFGASMLSILFVPMINVLLKIIIFLALTSIFVIFAFVKIDETNSDKYFIYILSLMSNDNFNIFYGGKYRLNYICTIICEEQK